MQNVKTPRFYVDYLSFLNTLGGLDAATGDEAALGLNMQPFYRYVEGSGGSNGSNWVSLKYTSSVPWSRIIPTSSGENKVFVAILGHNLKSLGLRFAIHFGGSTFSTPKEVLNAGVSGLYCYPYMDGASIVTMDEFAGHAASSSFQLQIYNPSDSTNTGTLKIGGIAMGVLWDAPHSPDMSLKLGRLYDGVNIQQSIGGSKFATASYVRANQAFEMGGAPFANARTGKRAWNMKFSYVGSSHLMADNELLTYGADLDGDGAIQADADGTSPDYLHTTDSDGNNVLTSLDDYDFDSTPDFYSRVVHRTMGGMLPFVFQPDNSNNSPDQFAIARFNQNAFVYNQVAHNVYDVSLDIEEEC